MRSSRLGCTRSRATTGCRRNRRCCRGTGESEERIRALPVEVLDETGLQVMTLHYAEEMPLDAITRLLSLKNTSGAKAYIVSAKRKLSTAVARRKYAGVRPVLERRDE